MVFCRNRQPVQKSGDIPCGVENRYDNDNRDFECRLRMSGCAKQVGRGQGSGRFFDNGTERFTQWDRNAGVPGFEESEDGPTVRRSEEESPRNLRETSERFRQSPGWIDVEQS